MPSLKSIRKRIGSVKNTRKITRAMKLVAAAKLRRAQEAITAARPYAQTLSQVVSELVAVAGDKPHPLFVPRARQAGERERVQILVISSDRGLAGALNTNVIKKVESLLRGELADADVTLYTVGRKGTQYFQRRQGLRGINLVGSEAAPTSATALTVSKELAARAIGDFLENRVDRVIVVYNEFRSAISQSVTAKQIVPIAAETAPAHAGATGGEGASGGPAVDYIYEPDKQALLARLAPQFVQIGLFRAALESIASEFGARMSAMESATKNAGEMISRLTLQYNRARQASITKELLEIIGGAEALKG